MELEIVQTSKDVQEGGHGDQGESLRITLVTIMDALVPDGPDAWVKRLGPNELFTYPGGYFEVI